MSYRVLVNGAAGKMGAISVQTLKAHPDFGDIISAGRKDDLATLLREHQPDIVVDFTLPDCVYSNAQLTLEHRARPIIGASGLSLPEIKQLTQLAEKLSLGGIIAPNFSLSAILLMKYAADAARYFADAEIIEAHHPQKIDAPSGTALKTAQLIEQTYALQKQKHDASPPGATTSKPALFDAVKGDDTKTSHSEPTQAAARGDLSTGCAIHSLRLPGCFAEQSVIFGGQAEWLTLSQRASSREAMMPGLILACQKVMQLDHMVYGLENILAND